MCAWWQYGTGTRTLCAAGLDSGAASSPSSWYLQLVTRGQEARPMVKQEHMMKGALCRAGLNLSATSSTAAFFKQHSRCQPLLWA